MCSPVVSPPRDLSQEGPFDAYSVPSDMGDLPLISEVLSGCLYRMTSYDSAEVADVDPAYGLQLHHPRFLEYVRAPESAQVDIKNLGLPSFYVIMRMSYDLS